MIVTPLAQGACTMIVADQYGEQVQVPINVAPSPTPWQNFGTWPASLVLGANGGAVGYTTTGQLAYEAPQSILARVAPIINALLGGGVARAQATVYTGVCYAQAFESGTSGAIDTASTLRCGCPQRECHDGRLHTGCRGRSAIRWPRLHQRVRSLRTSPGCGQTGNFINRRMHWRDAVAVVVA